MTVKKLDYRRDAIGQPSSAARAGLRQPPLTSMPVEYLTPAIEDRAVEVLVG